VELRFTVVLSPETMNAYIQSALQAQIEERKLPFVIVRQSSGQVVGTKRYYNIEPKHRRPSICNIWIAANWQRTTINTEAKFMLLRRAFEVLNCILVGFVTDILNKRSQIALLRIGAKQEGILRHHMTMEDGRY
jgi:RimJ/RimL family protein N-acetyltransferase